MNLVLWIIFGMLSGVIANWIHPKKSMPDLVGSIVLGAMGALLGGMLANVILQVNVVGFNLVAFLVALFGSTILLMANNSLQKN